MNIIIEFLKSLVMPRSMAKHRNMSILVSICVVVVTVYLFMWPTQSYYTRNVHKLVEKDNLESLQVLDLFPTNGEELEEFVSDINYLGLLLETNNELRADNLGVKIANVNASGNLIGLLSKNYENNRWSFKNNDYEEDTNVDIIETPDVKAGNDSITIDEISITPIEITGIVENETIDTIKVTLNNRSRVLINDKLYDDLLICTKDITFGEKDGFLTINDKKVDFKLDNKSVVYYVRNSNVTYYENTFSYKGEDNYYKEIKFIIDLSSNYVTSYDYKYDNEIGFNGDLDNIEYFYIMCNKQGVYYQAHPLGIEDANIVHNGVKLESSAIVSGYNYKKNNLSNLTQENFGNTFLKIIETGYVDNVRTQYLFITLLDVVLMPFIFTFLFFILFKKNGRLKKFKEYLNISTISSLLPILIAFIVLWIYPQVFSYVFLLTYGIWYLFVVYRINSYNGMI